MGNPQSEWDEATPITSDEWDTASPISKDEWDSATPISASESQGFIGNVSKDLGKRVSNIASQWVATEDEGVTDSFVNAGGRMFRTVGQIAGGVNDIIGEGLKSGYKTFVPEQAQKAIGDTFNQALQSDVVKSVAPTFKTLADAYAVAKQKYPDVIGNIEAAGNIASLIPVGWGVGKTKPIIEAGMDVVSPYARAATELAGDVAGSVTRKSPAYIENEINKAIDRGIEKGIRPTVVGKDNIGQIETYKERAKTAVKEIVNNKEGLALTDVDGNVIEGALPKTLTQFSEAIDQTKKRIFKQYDELAKTTGSQNAKVQLTPVVKELDGIINQTTLQDLHPEIVKYAEMRSNALSKRGAYTTTEAQDAITQLNKSLESFYRNPSYENAQKAGVDAVIANNLRTSLDTVIEGATEGGYQELKNSYGALKTIEKEVAHRAVVDARKNIKGLVDFTDIYTSGELVAGLATMNPGMIVRGTTWKTVQQYIKAMNNPNRIIKNMFGDVERLMNRNKPRVSQWTPKE